jgi:hypothetical protein
VYSHKKGLDEERYIQMIGAHKAVEVSAPDLARLAIEADGGLLLGPVPQHERPEATVA